MKTIRTPKNREVVLAELNAGLSVAGACRSAGISRVAAYAWRNDDAEFAAEWDDAVEAGTDNLEDIAVKRASDSSDTLLIFLLKARRPDKFKDKIVNEHTGKDGGPVQVIIESKDAEIL